MTDQTRELERLSKQNDELVRQLLSSESIDGTAGGAGVSSIANQSGGAAAFFNMFDATNPNATVDSVSPSSLLGGGKEIFENYF
jgi:hypothetical protein